MGTTDRVRKGLHAILTASLLAVCGWSSPLRAAGKPVTVTSPDKHLQLQLSADGALRYQILVDGKPLLGPSALGILSNDQELGQDVTLGTSKVRLVDEHYKFWGAHAVAVNRAQEATVEVTSHGQHYQVDLHVANDGVAARMRLPAVPGRRVQADRSTWTLNGDPTIWVSTLDSGYEHPFVTTSVSKMTGQALGLPLTARVGSLYVTVTEAALKDYGDLGVTPTADGTLQGNLYADPQGWTTDRAVVQPWRVAIIARDLNELVNTTLVQNLNPAPPADLANADWIKPGRSSWQWLSIGAPKSEDQEQWVDATSQLGYEYYLIDEGWAEWNDPWGRVSAVAKYARDKNVKIWVWVHSKEVFDPASRKALFRKAVDAGVVGIKIDFPKPNDHEWSNWYIDTARDAAADHLMLDFHGAVKPTGLERTWPNIITREAVRGHEYHITRYHRRLDDAHDTILPFTRYVVGPADYTPTVFTPSELQGNTWGHEVAQAIIFTSPYLCFGGNPTTYLNNAARDVLTAIPAIWDETRVLPGSEPGQLVVEARRRGDQWFIAVINGGEARHLDIPLNFLGTGTFRSVELFDGTDRPDAWNRKTADLRAGDHISMDLVSRGGFVAWLKK